MFYMTKFSAKRKKKTFPIKFNNSSVALGLLMNATANWKSFWHSEAKMFLPNRKKKWINFVFVWPPICNLLTDLLKKLYNIYLRKYCLPDCFLSVNPAYIYRCAVSRTPSNEPPISCFRMRKGTFRAIRFVIIWEWGDRWKVISEELH